MAESVAYVVCARFGVDTGERSFPYIATWSQDHAVLKSAMANAEDQGVRNVGDLVVADARGDGGPMFKRIKPVSRGQAYMIKRRTAHIKVSLDVV